MKPGALTALLQEVAATPEQREDEPLSLPPGTVIGRFEILRELGRGGFGVVYEARDRDLGRQVAVKVVRPGRIAEEEGKVSREAEAIARLSHPNLITLLEVGRSDHGPYLVFELCAERRSICGSRKDRFRSRRRCTSRRRWPAGSPTRTPRE